jgi:hypothetical protein
LRGRAIWSREKRSMRRDTSIRREAEKRWGESGVRVRVRVVS